jgi:hypothetical protein
LPKSGWMLLLVSMLSLLIGCSMLGGESAEKSVKEEGSDPKVATIIFGDYPQDEGNYEIIHPRKHFGKSEDFALAFQLSDGQKFDVTRLKFQIIKSEGDRLLQEVMAEVEPDKSELKWHFTQSGKFHSFYENGNYRLKVWRGKDLLAMNLSLRTDFDRRY